MIVEIHYFFYLKVNLIKIYYFKEILSTSLIGIMYPIFTGIKNNYHYIDTFYAL